MDLRNLSERFRNTIRTAFEQRSNNVLKTPYGSLNLAKTADREKAKKAVIALRRSTDALTRKDLGDWRGAWQMAINVDSPRRYHLYDIYRDVDVDLHLSGCIEQREGFVMAHSFKLVNADGSTNDAATDIIDSSWFKQLVRLVLQSRYWGHSLIELGDVVKPSVGIMRYDDVKLIPRKHVVPEYHRIIEDTGMDWTSGLDYHDDIYSPWLIEAGAPDDLGLYLKAATQTIPKKNDLAFWDTFAEIFGMPMRIAKTTSRDQAEIQRLSNELNTMGAALTAVMNADTEIQIVESAKGDAYNVYDKRIDRANTELSKLIIGQTMTIEDGSSLSQSETHLKVFENLVEQDCDLVRDIVNNQLLPRMIQHGFPVEGTHFEWDYSEDYTPSQQIQFETMIADRYEVDPQYFADKYNMPVGARRENVPAMTPPTEENAKEGGAQPFFD